MIVQLGASVALLLAFAWTPGAISPAAETKVDNKDAEVQSARSASTGPKAKPSKASSGTINPQAEANAKALVEAHLPQLKGLLQRLRHDQPREYVRAIQDLAKSARKLELARNRDERLYDIEVELLQARTQADLLTARLKVRDNPRDRKQLRETVARLHKATIQRAQYDVDFYRDRLERAQRQLDAAIRKLDDKQTETHSQQLKTYNAMLRKAGRKPDSNLKPDSGSANSGPGHTRSDRDPRKTTDLPSKSLGEDPSKPGTGDNKKQSG